METKMRKGASEKSFLRRSLFGCRTRFRRRWIAAG